MTKTDDHGTPHVALAIVDHASRACLRLEQLPDKSSPRLLQACVRAVKQDGPPQFVRRRGDRLLGDGEQIARSSW
jgi:hypothetical protein